MVVRGALIALLVFAPALALAQGVPLLESSIELSTTPANPAPGETVRVQVAYAGAASGGVTFVWRVDGAVVDQGVGRSAITVDAPRAGGARTVSVSLSENGVIIGERSVVLRGASVDIVWEGDTYTPPWYPGRPLMNGSGTVTLLAIPEILQNGVRVPSTDLVYRWYVNHSQTPEASGYGLRAVTLSTPQFESPFTVSVIAETRDGAVRAENAVVITPTRPLVAIYERASLQGLRTERAVGDEVALVGDEITLVAHPLFVADIATPEYAWDIGGDRVEETGRTVRELTLRREGEGSGRFRIGFTLEHARLLFERARTNFLLTF